MIKETQAKAKMITNIRAYVVEDDSLIPKLRELAKNRMFDKIKEMKDDGLINREYAISNLVSYVGIQEVMKYLANQDVNSGGINYGALGDGTPSPTTSSTGLDNEVYRKVKASAAYADNFVYVDFVYLKADVDGTFTEFGSFVNSTAVTDDPYLWSFIDTGGWVKSSLETLFVACEYSIVNQ